MLEPIVNYFEDRQDIDKEALEYQGNKIYDYHTYPVLNYYDVSNYTNTPEKGKRYFGLEIEREINRDNFYDNLDHTDEDLTYPEFHSFEACQTLLIWLYEQKFHTLEDYVWTSRDSSITYGLEFITHPCTVDYWLSTPVLESICDKLSTTSDHYETGLHIHVSNNFNKIQQCLIVLFITVHKDIFEVFAGRQENEYCLHEDLYLLSRNVKNLSKSSRTFRKLYDTLAIERNSAVNITSIKPTIEFRLFKSSVDVSHLKNCIVFCDSICNFISKIYKRSSNDSYEQISAMRINKDKEFKEYMDYLKSIPAYNPLYKELLNIQNT